MTESDSGDGHFDFTSSIKGAAVEIDNDQAKATYDIVKVEHKPAIPTPFLSTALGAVSLANSAVYVGSLIANVVSARKKGQENLLPAALFTAAQVFDHFSIISEGLWRLTVSVIRNPEPRPALRVLGDNVPGVDLFIVACGEPTDIVLDTVKAACQIDYPVESLRVIVADDGDDELLKKEANELRNKHPNLHYYARHKPYGIHHGYKSGNLNTAMRYVDTLFGGQSEFLSVLDADMIPEPYMLRALIPHALKAENIGMVTGAQHYYNIPDNDPLYQSNVTGTEADDGVRDSVGAAWCPGSGFILRNAAWKSIGGFPEFTITEDLMTSWFLHGHGWQIVLLHEKLQWGIQPDCFLTHMKQRRRWWIGHVRDAIHTNFSLNDQRLEQATTIQRVAMFHHCCRPYFNTVFKLLCWMLIALSLVLGGPVIATPEPHTLRNMVFCVVVHRVQARVSELRAAGHISLWNQRRQQATNTWMGLHFARDVLQSLLPKWTGGGLRLGFDVSGLEAAPVKERDIQKRPPVLKRIVLLHQREGILWHMAFFVIMVLFVIRGIRTQIKMSTTNGRLVIDQLFWFRFFSSVGFPGLSMIETVPLFLTPVVYAIFPPTMPSRRDRMVFDEQTGLWRPNPKSRDLIWTSENFWLEIPHCMGTLWLVFTYLIVRRLEIEKYQK
ncbi:uncharacterized protein Z518_08018 [Rhinocladiella mackenziei CBS 650.93]|uniref:Glycosyltransferase 2-like domain-containing protein n=1 Tax=Rhinocladiella mackenziei CBS 650.93 TaxID=1442369 RepID=A0A0D2I8A4_9EURO|nr:uncharacterized protein Z518_08018 [Rhinocladiella mackenziei CBS 650.93]KIX02079.1 hypothetical protein Z518_08018 [Rhinocladiella mackenziei CBS 650.93]